MESKILFVNFIYDFVGKYLIPGSFKLSYCDTDSIAIGKYFLIFLMFILHRNFKGFTKTWPYPDNADMETRMRCTFLPLVKPDMLNEFMQEWGKWLVLKDEIDQTKQPGLLKSNLLFFYNLRFKVLSSINKLIFFQLSGKLGTVLFVRSVQRCIKLMIIQMRN